VSFGRSPRARDDDARDDDDDAARRRRRRAMNDVVHLAPTDASFVALNRAPRASTPIAPPDP
jgi:hypothetical protein